MTAPAFLSERDLAGRWGVGKSTVQRLRAAGKLPYFRPVGTDLIRYRMVDIETFEANGYHDAVVVGIKRFRRNG